MLELEALEGVASVSLDQCMYGLAIHPDEGPTQKSRKSTRFLGNLLGLESLSRKCDKTHDHRTCLGNVRVGGRVRSVTRLAGAYPGPLCEAIAERVRGSLLSGALSGAPGPL